MNSDVRSPSSRGRGEIAKSRETESLGNQIRINYNKESILFHLLLTTNKEENPHISFAPSLPRSLSPEPHVDPTATPTKNSLKESILDSQES